MSEAGKGPDVIVPVTPVVVQAAGETVDDLKKQILALQEHIKKEKKSDGHISAASESTMHMLIEQMKEANAHYKALSEAAKLPAPPDDPFAPWLPF